MDQTKVIQMHKSAEPTIESDVCGRCHMQVARFALQVITTGTLYHRECYEAWYFGRHGRRPSLLAGVNGDRHRYHPRDRAA
jgi:hypothetical protein